MNEYVQSVGEETRDLQNERKSRIAFVFFFFYGNFYPSNFFILLIVAFFFKVFDLFHA